MADDLASQSVVRHRTPSAKPATENAVVPLQHLLQKPWYFGRLATESGMIMGQTIPRSISENREGSPMLA